MGGTDAELDAVLRGCADRLREQAVVRHNAMKNGDIAAEARADSAFASILSTTANSIPTSPWKTNNEKRQAVKQDLTKASQAFSTPTTPANRSVKDKVIVGLKTFLHLKSFASLFGTVGLLGVGLLAVPQVFQMSDGTLRNGDVIDCGNGTSTLLVDENNNGILDHEETINNATGAIIDPYQSIGIGDTIQNLWDIVSNFF